jgi:CheY-like chemotaxis protein
MKGKILIVDDTEIVSRMLGDILQMEGFGVVYASNGFEAFNRLSAEKPDLIITDIMMPVMDGVEFINKIRKDEAYKNIPVIILSALTAMENLSTEAAKVQLQLPKPCEAQVLLNSVNGLLNVNEEN